MAAYLDTYRFYRYPVEGDGGVRPFKVHAMGPVFPDFLSADLKTLEGFLEFSELWGMDGFGFFSEGLKKYLADNLKAAAGGYPRRLRRSPLKSYWREIKDEIVECQSLAGRFFRFQQQLHEKRSVRVINPNFRRRDNAVAHVAGLPLDLLFEGFGDINRVAPYLKVTYEYELDAEVVGRWPGSYRFTSVAGKLPVAAKRVPVGIIAKSFRPLSSYPSVVHRSFMEIAGLIINDQTVRRCACCHRNFIPKRPNEKYCERQYLTPAARSRYEKMLKDQKAEYQRLLESMPAFEKDDAWTAVIDLEQEKAKRPAAHKQEEAQFNEIRSQEELLKKLDQRQRSEAAEFLNRHTCKRVGRAKTYRNANKQYTREYQRLWKQKETVQMKFGADSSEFKKASSALVRHKKSKPITRRKRKVNHG